MKRIKHLTTALFASVAFVAAAPALAQDTPTAAPAGVTLVNAAKVQELQAGGAILVDARRAAEYGEGSIKGAKSVPYDPEKSAKDANFDSSQDKYDLSKIPNKDAKYVVFCNSGSCWKSFKAAVAMAKAGYKNVFWYRDGVPDWKARKLPME